MKALRVDRSPRQAPARILLGRFVAGVATVLAAIGGLGVAPANASAATPTLAAPLPLRPLIAQGVSSADQAHLLRDRGWDFAQMRKVFNAVSLLPGDPGAVQAAHYAGLAVIMEFDYKSYFFNGQDITAKVDAVVRQVRAAPGTIAAIDVADRLNEKYSPAQGLQYLAATAGVFHRELPGVPVIVNVSDWQLTCGRPEQSSCASHDSRFQYEVDSTLDTFYRSGYVDGFTIADNIKNNNVEAQQAAWTVARNRWAPPFLLWSTCSQLSFPDDAYPGTAADASQAAAAYMTAPVDGGADGLALWAWHQLYSGSVYSFLNKDGAPNPMWTAMTSSAAQIESGTGPATAPSRPLGSSAAAPAPGHAARNAPSSFGFWPIVAFAAIALTIGVGLADRARRRLAEQRGVLPHRGYLPRRSRHRKPTTLADQVTDRITNR